MLAAANFLLDEVAVHDRSVAVPDGAVVDVLPPVAGRYHPASATGLFTAAAGASSQEGLSSVIFK